MRVVREQSEFIVIACKSCGKQHTVEQVNWTKTSRGYDLTPTLKCSCGNVGIAASNQSDKKINRIPLIVVSSMIVISFITQGYKQYKEDQNYKNYHAELKAAVAESNISKSELITNYEVGGNKQNRYNTLAVHLKEDFEKMTLKEKYELLQSYFNAYDDKRFELMSNYDLYNYDVGIAILLHGIAYTSKGTYEFGHESITEPNGDLHLDTEFEEKEAVTNVKQIDIGMSDSEVKSILGEPDEVLNTEADSKGDVRFRWWYKGKGYLYFADYKVWQVLFP